MQPWQMWGSDKGFDLTPGNQQTAQVSRIDYGRPETWSFTMALKVTSGSAPAPVNGTVDCAFDLFVGSGRSTIQIRNFMNFQVNILDLSNAAVGPLLWGTETISPQRVFPPSGNTFPCDSIVAQSINAEARVLFTCVDPLATVQLVASCFFAPRTHVRPEWFKGGEFKGGENNGL
jgi:hypothetical protein